MLSAEVIQILNFLKTRPEEFFPESEIGRRVGGRALFHSNPTWARRVLAGMLEAGLIEQDERGFYRCRPEPTAASPTPSGRAAPKRWVSPQIASILKQSGRKFDGLNNPEPEK